LPRVQLDPPPSWAFFWFGLAGIIATGFLLAIGGDYWTLSQLTPTSSRLRVLLVGLAVLVGIFDICGCGVIFAGGVILVQRLRGRT
jgi:4-amino-4-deoxy-L-arabinose transferase-like glycosyltransferase